MRGFETFTMVVLLAVMAPMSTAYAADQQPTAGSVSGTIRDASGGVLPGVSVTLTETATGVRRWNTTDGAGRFAFADLTPSQYELIAELPGFATILNQLKLEPGENLQRSLSMRIGALAETIRVGCSAIGAELAAGPGRILASDAHPRAPRLFPTTSFAEAQQAPVRVGGNIQAPSKVRDVKPTCPRGVLPPLLVGTVVKLEATIGTDGFIKDVRSLDKTSGGSQARFVDSATEAVRQWQFTPTRLNNVPVPVIVSITVEYHRM